MNKNTPINNIKVCALGGLGEVGKNMYMVEIENEIIIIDSGILFPDIDLGINYIIPDYTYLIENEKKIIGLFITHGHEDHIGGIPYLLQQVKIPTVYASGLAIGLIKNKINQFANLHINLKEYHSDTIYNFKHFEVSFFRTNHSIPDSFGIAMKTYLGYIIHTGDFKFDFTPIAYHTEYAKITKFSTEGILLLMGDSTNANVNQLAPSESYISSNIKNIFSQIKGRIIISTFASNIYRIQQIVEASVASKRKIIVFGRSMEKAISIGQQLKYIKAPANTFITAKELPHLQPQNITILSTGSQGEPLAALSRIANNSHRDIKIIPGDTIVFSSSAIPGNQESINRIINKLYKANANVIVNSPLTDTHTSGHASRTELLLMLSLTKPKYFMPIHGEYAMQNKHVELAVQTGVKKENCFILENGDVLTITPKKAEKKHRVKSGDIFIDKNNQFIDSQIMRERKLMCDDGILSIAFITKGKKLMCPPNIISRGFIYIKNSEELLNSIEKKALQIFNDYFNRYKKVTMATLKTYINSELTSFIYEKTEKKPIIVPTIINL